MFERHLHSNWWDVRGANIMGWGKHASKEWPSFAAGV
jgi:hypothetical protein